MHHMHNCLKATKIWSFMQIYRDKKLMCVYCDKKLTCVIAYSLLGVNVM